MAPYICMVKEKKFLEEYSFELKKSDWTFTNIKGLTLSGKKRDLLKLLLEKKYIKISMIPRYLMRQFSCIINYDFSLSTLSSGGCVLFVNEHINQDTLAQIELNIGKLIHFLLERVDEKAMTFQEKSNWEMSVMCEKNQLNVVDLKGELDDTTFKKALISELSSAFIKNPKKISIQSLIECKPNYDTPEYFIELQKKEDAALKKIRANVDKVLKKDPSKNADDVYNELLHAKKLKDVKAEQELHKEDLLTFRLCGNAQGLECISDPIFFDETKMSGAISYVVSFKVLPQRDKEHIRVMVNMSIRRWICENEPVDLGDSKTNSIYISFPNSSYVTCVESVRITLNKDNSEVKRVLLNGDEEILASYNSKRKDFSLNDLLNNTAAYLKEKCYIGIPINQTIVNGLSKDNVSFAGLGSLEKIYIFKLILESFKKNLPSVSIEKSPNATPIKQRSANIVKKTSPGNAMEFSRMFLEEIKDEEFTLFYYCEKPQHRTAFECMLGCFIDTSCEKSPFILIRKENDYSLYEILIGQIKYILKVIFIETTLFAERITKNENEEGKAIQNAHEKYINFIATTMQKYQLDFRKNRRMLHLVDMEDFSKYSFTVYGDPYKPVKRAFSVFNQNVQMYSGLINFTNKYNDYVERIRRLEGCTYKSLEKEFNSPCNILKNTILDMFMKKGVTCAFSQKEKVYETIRDYGYEGIVGIGTLSIGAFIIIVALKHTRKGLFFSCANVTRDKDRLIICDQKWESFSCINERIRAFKDFLVINNKKQLISDLSKANEQLLEILFEEPNIIMVAGSFYRANIQKNEMLTNKNRPLVIVEDTTGATYNVIGLKQEGYKITHYQGLFKSTGGYYLSVGERGDTLQKSIVESFRYKNPNADNRKRKAVIIDVLNAKTDKEADLLAEIAHSTRNMNIAYEVFTNIPHLIYLISNLGSEVDKCI